LFAAFDRLVQIEVCGRSLDVPEHNNLLRCFQYIEIDKVSAGNYCWNGDCSSCMVWLKPARGEARCALACRTPVREGLVVTKLSAELQFVLTKIDPV
jgi:hypothetical protein